MIESVGSTIEERKENSNENVKYVKKKQVKMSVRKLLKWKKAKRSRCMNNWSPCKRGTDLRFKIPIQENIL